MFIFEWKNTKKRALLEICRSSMRTGALAVYWLISWKQDTFIFMTQFIYSWILRFFLFLFPLLVIMCSLFSRSTWCSGMGTYRPLFNINVKDSQLACDLVSLMNVIIGSLLWLICWICLGIFPKIRSFEPILLSFDVEQKPHTLNMQILLLTQNCMQCITGINITLHWSHADRDTSRQIYLLIYTKIFSSSMVIPFCGVNDFSNE